MLRAEWEGDVLRAEWEGQCVKGRVGEAMC